ncbi:hypothetical protein ACFLIM_26550 [Nonomuraea sp. M3C6]|uniref:Uncharacterized protein n=1 Tax=Nonomuraea marmarensis TaxID=3351344 RepID=A0ABW7AKF0_9ACTN
MRRRAHLLATAALVSALAPIVAGTPWEGAAERAHSIRDALISAGSHFYGLAEILGDNLRSGSIGI